MCKPSPNFLYKGAIKENMIRRFNMILGEIINGRNNKSSCSHVFISMKPIMNESSDQPRSRRGILLFQGKIDQKRQWLGLSRKLYTCFILRRPLSESVHTKISSISMNGINILEIRDCRLGKAVLMLSGIFQFLLFKKSLTFEVRVLW